MTNELKNKKLLVICESPNKCAHIQEYLKKAGYNVKVMASVGHIMELKNSGSYYNSGVDVKNNFELDLGVSEDKKDVVKKIKAQVDWADLVYLMSDPDREGFVISWSLIKFLKLAKSKYRRAITHEITPKAVVAAVENPIPMDNNLVDAGLARMTLDKMVGFRLSPIAKNYIGAKSVGRCQSAGLKLIVDREKEIQSFNPETYFDLYLNFEKNNTKFKAKYVGNSLGAVEHLKSQTEVDKIKSNCINNYVIEGISKKEKQENPKPPFCTSTFQQEAASKLSLKVKDAMSIAQSLFESGNITYMRTDDTVFAPEFIPSLKSFITDIYGAKSFTAPRVGKKQENAQEGHECLRVTDPYLTPEDFAKIDANSLHQKVYKLIWQRTIAAALPNAIISETAYLIDNNDEKFMLVSNEIVDMGYKIVYSYKDDEDKDEDGPVKETFKKGEILKDCSLEDVKKQTKPKPRFTEATFIRELEHRGIGRPSTFASIVETVLSVSRGYAELDEKQIVPTERGFQLINFLDRSFNNIINIDYTKEMEKSLDLIASGKLKKLDFLNEFYSTLESTIKNSKELQNEVDAGDAPNCPKCGAIMKLRRSKFGKAFWGCSNYPKCNGIVNIK